MMTEHQEPKPLSDRIDQYIADITALGIIEDLARIPNRTDYPSVAAWMRALEAYRDGVIAPTEDDTSAEEPGVSDR